MSQVKILVARETNAYFHVTHHPQHQKQLGTHHLHHQLKQQPVASNAYSALQLSLQEKGVACTHAQNHGATHGMQQRNENLNLPRPLQLPHFQGLSLQSFHKTKAADCMPLRMYYKVPSGQLIFHAKPVNSSGIVHTLVEDHLQYLLACSLDYHATFLFYDTSNPSLRSQPITFDCF